MEHDLRLHWPFRMLMAGSSSSGKSTLTIKLVTQADETMSRIPKKIILFYSHMQLAYKDVTATAPCCATVYRYGSPWRRSQVPELPKAIELMNSLNLASKHHLKSHLCPDSSRRMQYLEISIFKATVVSSVRSFYWYNELLKPSKDGVTLKPIAQIAPLSFQATIAHRPRQVRWGELHA